MTQRKLVESMIDAIEDLRKELRSAVKLDVKKHFSLMAADAQAGTAVFNARSALDADTEPTPPEPAPNDPSAPARILEIKNLAQRIIDQCEQLDGQAKDFVDAIRTDDGKTIPDALWSISVKLEAAHIEACAQQRMGDQDAPSDMPHPAEKT